MFLQKTLLFGWLVGFWLWVFFLFVFVVVVLVFGLCFFGFVGWLASWFGLFGFFLPLCLQEVWSF